MPKVKITITILIATLALGATAAGSAAAESWFVGGTKLSGTAALSNTAGLDQALTLSLPVLKAKVRCTGPIAYSTLFLTFGEFEIGFREVSDGQSFSHCSGEPSPGCELEGQPTTIEMNPQIATPVTAKSPEDRLTFRPTTKKTLGVLKFKETNSCALKSEVPINGSYTLALPTGQTESVTQASEGLGSVENKSLEVAGNEAFIEGGRSLIKLQSGSKWGFH
jgi:hypothetical protein